MLKIPLSLEAAKRVDTIVYTAFTAIEIVAGIRGIISARKHLLKNISKITMSSSLSIRLKGLTKKEDIQYIIKWAENLYDFYYFQFKRFLIADPNTDLEEKLHYLFEAINREYIDKLIIFCCKYENEDEILDIVDELVFQKIFNFAMTQITDHYKYLDLSRQLIFSNR